MSMPIPEDSGYKKNNSAQSKTEIDYRQLYDDSPIAFYICNTDGYLTYFNQAAKRLWGTDPQMGKTQWGGFWKIYHSDGSLMPSIEYPIVRTLEKKIAFTNEEIILERPDRTKRNVLIFTSPVFNADHKIVGAHSTLLDITVQRESHLKKKMLSAIVESSDDAIFSKDLEGIIKSWNPGAERIFGYTEAEMKGKSTSALIPEQKQEEEEKILQEIQKGKKVRHFKTTRKSKDGKDITVSLTISLIKDNLDRIIGTSTIARDLSEELAQAEIKKNSENLEILNSIGQSISENLDVREILQKVTDATTKLTGAAFGSFFYNHKNEEGKAMMLYTLSGAPKEAFEKFGFPRHTDVFRPTFAGQGIVRADDITKDPRYGRNNPHSGMPQGHLPVVSYLAVPVVSKTGSVFGGLIFGHPERGVFNEEHEKIVLNIAAQAAISIDNSRLFEQVKLLSAKKDEFIALASHELKTPLTTIKGYLQVIAKMEKDQQSTVFLTRSLNQVDKLNTLIEDLLNMSRIEAGKLQFTLEDFDIILMLKEIVEIQSYTHSSHRIVLNTPKEPVLVRADKQRIEQVVQNLLSNAIKYSPEADEVHLKLENDISEVTIRIRDEGIGLTPEEQNQLFTRFYRADNKKGISGLGLGLYLAKQIIDRHDGKLNVISKVGEGSEFSFSLPKNVVQP